MKICENFDLKETMAGYFEFWRRNVGKNSSNRQAGISSYGGEMLAESRVKGHFEL